LVLAAALNAYQMAPLLGRLAEDAAPPRRILLVCGEQGPKLGDKGEDHLQALRGRRNLVVEMLSVSAVELITLDALHAVWNLARGEDLEVTLAGGSVRHVTADEVIASHRRQGRFASSRVLAAALTCPPPAEPTPGQLEPAEPLPTLADP